MKVCCAAKPYRCLTMNEIYLYRLAVATLGIMCFACFTWGTIRHFVWHENGSAGAWVISLLSWIGLGVFIWQILSRPLSGAWVIACFLFTLSAALWTWTILRTRATPPTLAFTNDDPYFLLNAGPYGLVRHPFYSAYMLFWVGTALATQGVAGWVVVLTMGSIYWAAARQEESKFARSAMASCYRDYAAKTGRFFPRFWLSSRGSSSALR